MSKSDRPAPRGEVRGKRAGREIQAGSWWASGLVFRAACAILGVGAGVAIALLLGVGLSAMGNVSVAMDALLKAGAISGALCGGLAPRILSDAISGLMHFFAGLLFALGNGEVPEASRNEGWLKACCVLGALYAAGLSVGWSFFR